MEQAARILFRLAETPAPAQSLTEIEIPEPPPEARQRWFKFTLRRPVDFGVVSLAAVISEKTGSAGRPAWPWAPWRPPLSGPKRLNRFCS